MYRTTGPFPVSLTGQLILEEVMVKKDGEKLSEFRTGSTGSLPHIGVGWYRKEIDIPASMKGRRVGIEFDGAMSHARVYLNGALCGGMALWVCIFSI